MAASEERRASSSLASSSAAEGVAVLGWIVNEDGEDDVVAAAWQTLKTPACLQPHLFLFLKVAEVAERWQ